MHIIRETENPGEGKRTHRSPQPAAAAVEPFPEAHWLVYESVLEKAHKHGIPLALGGAMGIGTYTGQWRYTKDLDIYIQPKDRGAMVEILTESGLSDYHSKLAYDRGWIHRGHVDDVIVDLIWSMPNRRAEVDEGWVTRGPEIAVHGRPVRIVPAEEMVFAKLYVMQHERCDWPDLLNLLYAAGARMEWHRILERVDEDRPLLTALLSTFRWLAPGRAHTFPVWLWKAVQLGIPERRCGMRTLEDRAFLLDTRPWFLPTMKPAMKPATKKDLEQC